MHKEMMLSTYQGNKSSVGQTVAAMAVLRSAVREFECERLNRAKVVGEITSSQAESSRSKKQHWESVVAVTMKVERREVAARGSCAVCRCSVTLCRG